VVECTGSSTGLPTALRLVQPTGTIVLKTTIAGPHQSNLAPIVVDEIRVLGSRCGPFPPAIRALTQRRIDVRPLIGARFPLSQADHAFQEAGKPGAKKILMTV
jgi:threonine dehydrogenase-like Zn-dependent dehydrogenase